MEANEIFTETEVMDVITDDSVVEEVSEKITGSGLKIAAGVGVGVIAGVILYKYVAVPLIAKIKERKQAKHDESDGIVIEEVDESQDDEAEEE